MTPTSVSADRVSYLHFDIYWPCGPLGSFFRNHLVRLFQLLVILLNFLVDNLYSGEEITRKQHKKREGQHEHLGEKEK